MRSYLYNAECAKYCMWKHKKISLIIEKIELRQANNSVYLPFSCPIGRWCLLLGMPMHFYVARLSHQY